MHETKKFILIQFFKSFTWDSGLVPKDTLNLWKLYGQQINYNQKCLKHLNIIYLAINYYVVWKKNLEI